MRAFQSACRHRGVRLVEGPGTCERVHLPVPRVELRARRPQHLRLATPAPSPSTTSGPATSTSSRCGARHGAGAPGSTSTTPPRRCGQCMEPFATVMDAWQLGIDAGGVVVLVPAPPSTGSSPKRRSWSSTTCSRPTRSSGSPGRYPPRDRAFDPPLRRSKLHYLRVMSEGWPAWSTPTTCVAEGMQDIGSRRSGGPPDRSGTARLQRARWCSGIATAAQRSRPEPARGRGLERADELLLPRTSSCCRCAAAPHRTGSARSDRRRRSRRSGR